MLSPSYLFINHFILPFLSSSAISLVLVPESNDKENEPREIKSANERKKRKGEIKCNRKDLGKGWAIYSFSFSNPRLLLSILLSR